MGMVVCFIGEDVLMEDFEMNMCFSKILNSLYFDLIDRRFIIN